MYYAYTRVSTETQSEKGYGLDAQRAAIEKYAQDNDITIDGYYTDAGISGNLADDADDDAINKRAGLIELLATLKDGDAVVVLNTSRLWRSDMTKALIRRDLIKHGARVVSIEQPRYDIRCKDPNEYLINAIMEALDVYDRMSISLKLARGRTVKAQTGAKPAGACPYGYKYAPDKKSVIVDAAASQVVKLMYTEGQRGKTLSEIAALLNAKGYKTAQGKAWSRGTVQSILHNEFYTGTLTHAGKQIQGTHTPIISKVQFGKVAAQLERRKRG